MGKSVIKVDWVGLSLPSHLTICISLLRLKHN